MADIFDSVTPQNQSPQSQPQAAQQSAPPQAQSAQPQGDIFDQVTPGGGSQQSQPATPQLSDEWLHGNSSPDAVAAAKAANPPLHQLEQAGIGAVKSLGQTGSLILDYLTGGPTAVAMHAGGIESPNREKLDDALQPNGEDQKAGAMVEQLAEFMLGDLGAAKGIAATDKVGIVQDALKLAQKHPVVAKLLHAGMTALRQGSVATGTGLVHGEDASTAVEQGAAVAATGGTLEGLSSLASKAAPAVSKAASATVGKLWSSIGFQKTLQSGIRDAVSAAADDAGVEAGDTSIRKTVGSMADAVKEKSKGLFQTIDDATDGEFTNVQNKLKNVGQKLREIAGTDDDAEEKLFNQQTALHVKLDEAIEAAKKAGVEPEVAEQARNSWKQMSALEDLDTQVKLSTSGNVKNAPETVDPQKLANRLQKLEDSGRLSEALGDENANKLLQHAYDAVDAAKTQKTVATWGKRAAVGVGLAGGGSALGHVLSGSH